jgi:dienelactone hydrolase
MHTEDIVYRYGDLELRGFFAHDEHAARLRPGVLVVPDAGGLGEHIKDKARSLAALGYAAFVLDLYGDGAVVTDGLRRIAELGADIPRWRGLARAGLDVLAARPEVDALKLAAIGYCFGGTTVYELARSGAPLLGVVGFHSGLTPSSGEAANLRGRVLTLIGADDPMIPPEARVVFENELRAARVDWQMVVYGRAAHSFTNPLANRPGFSYEADADARSWAAMRQFFAEVFGGQA